MLTTSTSKRYDPQATYSYYSTYTDYTPRILNWGVPRENLLPSYATISDNGGGAGTIGYNWNAGNVADDQDEFVYNGSNYVMNSLNQVVNGTRFALVNIWLGESSHEAMSQRVDHDSDNASWMIIQKNDKWYIYNVGRKEFARG